MAKWSEMERKVINKEAKESDLEGLLMEWPLIELPGRLLKGLTRKATVGSKILSTIATAFLSKIKPKIA